MKVLKSLLEVLEKEQEWEKAKSDQPYPKSTACKLFTSQPSFFCSSTFNFLSVSFFSSSSFCP